VARRLPILLAGCAAAALLAAAPAPAAGTGEFSVSPQPKPGVARAYFDLTLGAGQSHRDAVVVSNASASTLTLKVGASRGETASASGVGYDGAFAPCTGPACWISGLPATVTLAPGARKTLPFTVTVPAGTAPQQYLAGITVQPAVTPSPTSLGSHGGTSAQAIIIHQVNVGVAVTVGTLSELGAGLRITGIDSVAIGTMPRLLIGERNTGQIFLHAKGTAVCTASGKTHTFDVSSDTVLPGQRAELAVNASGLPTGATAHCTVRLDYERGGTATHAAAVKIPAVKHVKVVQTAPGVFAEVPAAPGTPTWAIALIAVGGALVLVLLAAVAVLLLRNRRLRRRVAV
jgi:hypothetical protein